MKKYLLPALLSAFSFSYSMAQSYITTTVAGGNGAGSAADQLNIPQDVFVDAAGSIYVDDYRNNRIQKFPAGSDSTTPGVTVAGGNGSGRAANQLNYPTGIYVDSSGALYVADSRNGRIQKFPAGSDSTTNGLTVAAFGLIQPIGVYLDRGGNVYVSDGATERVRKYPAGSDSTTYGAVVAGNGGNSNDPYHLNQPNGIYVDSAGNLYVADYFHNRVQKFPAGSDSLTAATTVAGGNGAGTASNQFNGPVAVWLDPQGNLYVSDEVNNRIQKFPAGSDSATHAVTVVGDTTAGNGPDQLSYPNGIFVDSRGSIYIADGGNNRVQKWGLNTSGINTIPASENSLSLYPNPNSGSFILQSSGAAAKEYIIYDMIGRTVAQGTITSDKQNIDIAVPPSPMERAGVSTICAGSYTLEVQGSKAIWFVVGK